MPFPEAEARLLLDFDGPTGEEVEREVTAAGEALLECGALDVALAADEPRRRALWDVRRGIAEAIYELGVSFELDLAVPRSELVALVTGVRRRAAEARPAVVRLRACGRRQPPRASAPRGERHVRRGGGRGRHDGDFRGGRASRRHDHGRARRRPHAARLPSAAPPARVPRRDARREDRARPEGDPEPGQADPGRRDERGPRLRTARAGGRRARGPVARPRPSLGGRALRDVALVLGVRRRAAPEGRMGPVGLDRRRG